MLSQIARHKLSLVLDFFYEYKDWNKLPRDKKEEILRVDIQAFLENLPYHFDDDEFRMLKKKFSLKPEIVIDGYIEE